MDFGPTLHDFPALVVAVIVAEVVVVVWVVVVQGGAGVVRGW